MNMNSRSTRMPPRGVPEGERRERLLKAALRDAVNLMLKEGQTPAEIRDRRLDGTMHLLAELDPTGLTAAPVRDDVEHALSMPRIRAADKTGKGTPYQRLFLLIHTNPGTAEAKAFTRLLRALADSCGPNCSFASCVQDCRNSVEPENRNLLFETLEHYVSRGIDATLREVIWMIEHLGTAKPRSGEDDSPETESPA